MPKRQARRRREGQPDLTERPGWRGAHGTHDAHDDRTDGHRSQIPPSPAKGGFTSHARRAPRH